MKQIELDNFLFKKNRAFPVLGLCFFSAFLMISCNQVFVFKKNLTLNHTSFDIESRAGLKTDSLVVSLEAPGHEKFTLERQIDRKIYAAEIADLDANDVPEIYIFGKSNDEDEYGDVFSFTVDDSKGLMEIFVPTLDPYISKGYMGHDKFSVSEKYLNREFMVSRDVKQSGIQKVKYEISKSAVGLYLNELKSSSGK